MKFTKAFPNETGIPFIYIEDLLSHLQRKQIPLHSFLLLHHDKLITEAYFAPYDGYTLHRMFSITKSFTAVAIGLLIDEGKLSLHDKIIDYFPDKLPSNVHPWIAGMTIQDMLMMRTCHASTTYKIDSSIDWVRSFFTVSPTHPSGRVFHYDTSSTHTLCALVERLTNLDMLSFIRQKLPQLDLSMDSYLLTDPSGVSLGGSGLVSYPMDLLKFGYFISHDGRIQGEQLLSSSYIRQMTSCLSDTQITASNAFEAKGYGMQFWSMGKNGYMCYGMGGQFILFYPQHDLICVTTADTQGMSSANQQIIDAISELLLPNIQSASLYYTPDDLLCFQHYISKLQVSPLPPLAKDVSFATMPKYQNRIYDLSPNPFGFSSMQISFSSACEEDTFMPASNHTRTAFPYSSGRLHYTLDQIPCELAFGFGHFETGVFPIYKQKYFASASWIMQNTLYIKIHISDSYLGTLHFELSFEEETLTIFMKKQEESLFNEYSGHLFGLVSHDLLHSP